MWICHTMSVTAKRESRIPVTTVRPRSENQVRRKLKGTQKGRENTHQFGVGFPHWRRRIRRRGRFCAPQQIGTQSKILCEKYTNDEVPCTQRREIERRRVVLYTKKNTSVTERRKISLASVELFVYAHVSRVRKHKYSRRGYATHAGTAR